MRIENVKERAVELGVYLPLGAYTKVRDELIGLDGTSVGKLYEEFVDRGRSRVRPIERRLRRETGEIAGPASSTGRKVAARGRAAASSRAPKVTATVSRPSELPIASYDSLTVEEILPRLNGLTQTDLTKVRAYEKANGKRATVLNAIDSKMTKLPIADYDALTADEVSARIESLTTAQLKTLRRYEESTRGRVTVLDRIDARLA